MREFDGFASIHRGGDPPLNAPVVELIGFESKDMRDSSPGLLRSRFSAINTNAAQVGHEALDEFLKIDSTEVAESFAQRFGLLGLYPEAQFWMDSARVLRLVGEPYSSWLWHRERMDAVSILMSLANSSRSAKSIRTRIETILQGHKRHKVYRLTHEANDLGTDDPSVRDLIDSGAPGCIKFCRSLILRMAQETTVLYEFENGTARLSANCLLGFLYLLLGERHELLARSLVRGIALCRWCNADVQVGARGPNPIFCKSCLTLRGNYPEDEAFRRAMEKLQRSADRIKNSGVHSLLRQYEDRYGRDGLSRAVQALETGLR